MTYIPNPLRRMVYERAKGRCEYCLLPNDDAYWPHEIDHIFAEKHGGETVEANLCLSCVICNRFKGSDLASLDPETGEPVFLFHPRRDQWEAHFRLAEANIVPITPQARAVVRLLHMNDADRIWERETLILLGRYP